MSAATGLSQELDRDGAARADAIIDRVQAAALAQALEPRFAAGPGARLFGQAAVTRITSPDGALGRIAAQVLGPTARAVRALAFDKTRRANWAVGWHQDRTIAVRTRIETPGFGPWTIKDGVPHVEPPFAVMEGMITIRLHLDDCGPENAPLRVARGSHRLGRVASGQAAARAEEAEEILCLADAGDVWIYRTPVVHASRPASGAGRRRVVQVDFSASALPGGLAWAGIG